MTPWYVFRNHVGGLGLSRIPHDETVETFSDRADALAFIERLNGYTGPQRELSLAIEQNRKAA